MATLDPSRTRIRVWDLLLRLFHWALVAVVALAFLSAEEDSALNQWHIISGWVAGILVAFRIAWGFVGGEHSRFADFVRPSALSGHVRELLRGRPEPMLGHNPLGAMSVLLLLSLLLATVLTGAVLIEEPHELLGWTLLGLIAIHVVAVIVMSLLERENLVRAMIIGTKPAARHPGARDARRPTLAGGTIALLLLVGAVLAVRAYDPLAFTLRGSEAYEHSAEAEPGGDSAGHDEGQHEGSADD